jgi:hypothetical protein
MEVQINIGWELCRKQRNIQRKLTYRPNMFVLLYHLFSVFFVACRNAFGNILGS